MYSRVAIAFLVAFCVHFHAANETIALDMRERLSKILLNCHNGYRTEHNVDPLELDSSLTKGAQEHADEMSQKRQLYHTDPNILSKMNVGENIYTLGMQAINGQNPDEIFEANITKACRMWYCEARNYDFEQAKPQMQSLHFTQMIWKSAKKVGFGFSKDTEGNTEQFKISVYYVVAQYSPSGNTWNQFGSQVQKGNADIAKACPIGRKREVQFIQAII
ncbi:hypothetical protein ACOME3_007662 [Neoechinorhynchus agilis]